jgi:hypothetical protein
MIPKFLYTKDTTAYHLAMQELTAAINDSHGFFVTKYTYRYFVDIRRRLPVRLSITKQ